MEYTLRSTIVEYPSMDSDEPRKTGPYLGFTAVQLPEIALWEPGKDYYLVVKVKQTSYRIDKHEGKREESADFEVLEVGAIKTDDYHGEDADVVKKKLNM